MTRNDLSKPKLNYLVKEINKYLTNLKIVVPIIKKERLLQIASRDYNKHLKTLPNYSQYKKANPQQDDTKFLKRICLNYLRHKMTQYENDLTEMFGYIGYEIGYNKLKRKFNKEIIKTYSWLKF